MSDATIDIDRLWKLLSHTVGQEKAELAVRTAANHNGLSPRPAHTFDETRAVLEKVAETPGIVGVTARFAKSRLHLAAS